MPSPTRLPVAAIESIIHLPLASIDVILGLVLKAEVSAPPVRIEYTFGREVEESERIAGWERRPSIVSIGETFLSAMGDVRTPRHPPRPADSQPESPGVGICRGLIPGMEIFLTVQGNISRTRLQQVTDVVTASFTGWTGKSDD